MHLSFPYLQKEGGPLDFLIWKLGDDHGQTIRKLFKLVSPVGRLFLGGQIGGVKDEVQKEWKDEALCALCHLE